MRVSKRDIKCKRLKLSKVKFTMYLLFYIEGKTKKRCSKWLEGVDINYKNEFRHKGCFFFFVTCFVSWKFKLYIYKNEFWHKGCFSLLILSVRNSNCNTSHIPNSQLKIQIIAEHTQPCRVGTAASYRVLHNHYISSTALR